MATTLTTKHVQQVNWTFSKTNNFGNTSNSSQFQFTSSTSNGTGSGQADLVYLAQTTIGASSTLSLDLAGSLSDLFGNTITMVRVKTIYVELATTTTASSINVGGNVNGLVNWISAAADYVVIQNGGCFMIHAPGATAYAVTAGTGDILDITNNDGTNTATVKIAIVGASA